MKIVFARTARQECLELPRPIRRVIRSAIQALSVDPQRPPKLIADEMFWGEWEGYWRVRVGEYRVIYQIEHRRAEVTILRIGHRSGVYEGGPGPR